ncbi:hypothetical protein [Candidatus Methanoplasma termitum]|nr:hypothetical protein [Candidatus Methanoplasma termitum]MCL2334270.1 hypothetical protein [Candidatus Methanoplasma sp.]
MSTCECYVLSKKGKKREVVKMTKKKDTKVKEIEPTEEQIKATEILMMIDGMGTAGREILRKELEINRKGLIDIKIKLGEILEGKGAMDKNEFFWLREITLDIFLDVLEDEEDEWEDDDFEIDIEEDDEEDDEED